jgi:hypothetical protein
MAVNAANRDSLEPCKGQGKCTLRTHLSFCPCDRRYPQRLGMEFAEATYVMAGR